MSAKKIFCTIFYVIFSLLFTAILVCNLTGLLDYFGIVKNTLITTTINTNFVNPMHTAIDSLGIMHSATSLTIVYVFIAVMTLAFWILSVSNLANILRETSTRGASIATTILSIVMFGILGFVVVLLVRNGETIANVFANFYLVGQLIIYMLVLLTAILAMTIHNDDEPAEQTPPDTAPEGMTAKQREDRINEILNNEIDPRV